MLGVDVLAEASGKLACPEGIEPPTHSLEGCCSIQLSYGQRSREIDGRGERIRTFDPLVPNQMRYQAALRPDLVIVRATAGLFALHDAPCRARNAFFAARHATLRAHLPTRNLPDTL